MKDLHIAAAAAAELPVLILRTPESINCSVEASVNDIVAPLCYFFLSFFSPHMRTVH